LFSSIFITLAAAELVLRSLGALLLLPAALRNRRSEADREALRVLVLGESTSAEFFCNGKACSWPSQLEELLVSRGIKAKVYNEAVGGTNTSLLLLRLPGYLEAYRPQIVISMMGVNDTIRISLIRDSALWRIFDGLRVVKLARWINASLRRRGACELSDRFLDARFNAQVDRGFALSRRTAESEVEKALASGIEDPQDLALVLHVIGLRLRGDFSDGDPNNLLHVADYDDRAFALYPKNRSIAFQSIQVESRFPERSQCVDFSKTILACGENVDDGILTQILYCLSSHPDRELRQKIHELGVTLDSGADDPTTDNYRAVARMLDARGIRYIAMQYPTLPLAQLTARFRAPNKTLLPAFRKITFVSNEDNFGEALKTNSYDSLFLDRFRGSWGHATKKGNRLIAERAADAVALIVRESGR